MKPVVNLSPSIFLGVPIGRRPLDSLVNESIEAIAHRNKQIVFACANTHSVAVAQSDTVFMNALNTADQVVADGVGVSVMASIVNIDVGPRIVGEQYFSALMQELDKQKDKRVFFLGSTNVVLKNITDKISLSYPNITLCGTLSPPFKPWSEEENSVILEKINAAKPDVLWVGMTAPKQEVWTYQNRKALNVTVIGSVGAVFEFFAGTIPSPPTWVRKFGIESMHRLVSDKNPLRFWRRAFISIPKFIFLVIWRHGLKISKNN